jgi:dual specificity phosphatase 12
MKKFKISLQDATETVSDIRSSICPNAGFVRQLEQYYLNLHPELKKKEFVASIAESSSAHVSLPLVVETASISIEPHVFYETVPQQATVEVTEDKVVYSCRTCRRPLFTMDDIMPHQAGKHNIAYHKRDKGNATSSEQVVCSSFYLQEPLQWMGIVDENEGKIACSKCQSRVGFWKWDGQQCSCGTWVTPAIQIAKNRVDERIMPITSTQHVATTASSS